MENKITILNKIKFWLQIGLRFFNSKKGTGKFNFIFITLFLGISGGLMVLIVVLGVMNGFQENHITRRIEIGSYHITISKKDHGSFNIQESKDLKKRLYKKFDEIEAAIPFSDKEVMILLSRGYFSERQILKLRAVDPDEIKKDSRFLKYFHLNFGELELKDYSIILGEEMFYRLLAKKNSILYINPSISLRGLKNKGIPFTINNVFNTGSYDYDRFWGFISIHSLTPLTGRTEIDSIGIKLKNNNWTNQLLKKIKAALGEEYIFQTAEDINRGYFAALRLEKTMIILLFLMIFMMVATNTFGALKLTILEKKKDISILKAIGSNSVDIEVIFVIESLLLGFAGSFTGVFLGTLISYNINNIFIIIESIANAILNFITFIFEKMLPGIYFEPVKLYDNSIYYQTGFLIKINFYEIFIICILIICMTTFAAYLPVRKASKLKPVEVIKN